MTRLTVSEFGAPGFVRDIAAFATTPQAWDEVRNVRFNSIGAQTFAGESTVLSPANFSPLWLKAFPPIEAPIWVYAGLNRVLGITDNHFELTRLSGSYNGQDNERWQGEVLNGVGLFNNVVDVPQLWAEFDIAQRFVDLPGWPANLRTKSMRTFKNFVICLYMIEAGNERPYRMRWCDATEPGTVPDRWALNDPASFAGQKDISETEDYLVDGLRLGELFIVYKQQSVYAAQFIDRPDVFATWRLFGGRGLLWRDCVTEFTGGHFVAGLDDIYVHTGNRESSESVVEKKLRNWIFNQIDGNNFFNCFNVDYKRRSEIWFCFPEAGETYATLAAVWNKVTGGIGIRELRRTPFIYPGPIDTSTDTRIWGGVDEPVLTGNLDGSTGELSWTIPASDIPIIDYSLFRSVNGGAYTLLVTQAGTSFDDVGLTSGDVYDYYVTARTLLEDSERSNIVRLEPTGSDGALLIWPNSVLDVRTQSGVGILRTPDGYGAVAGVVTIPGSIGGRAVVAKATLSIDNGLDMTVRVTGTDAVAAVITEDISVNDATIYTIGSTIFFTITGITLLSSEEGGDGFYCAGYAQRTAPSTNGFDIITLRGALAINQSAPTAANVTKAGLLGDFGTTNPATLPGDSQLSIMRSANAAERTFTIDGGEAITLPTGSSGQEVLSVATDFTSVSVIASAGTGTNPFVDIGIIYRGPSL